MNILGKVKFFNKSTINNYKSRDVLLNIVSKLETENAFYNSEIARLNNNNKEVINIKKFFLDSISLNILMPLDEILETVSEMKCECTSKNSTWLNKIENSANTLACLFDNIVMLSLLQDKQYPVNNQICSAARILLQTYSIIMHKYDMNPDGLHNIRIGETGNAPDEFVGDPVIIVKIITELLRKTLIYCAVEDISIIVSLAKDNYQFTISYNGKAIKASIIPYIYNPFKRVNSIYGYNLETTDTHCIINELLQVTGYSIKINTKHNKGIGFTLLVPQ